MQKYLKMFKMEGFTPPPNKSVVAHAQTMTLQPLAMGGKEPWYVQWQRVGAALGLPVVAEDVGSSKPSGRGKVHLTLFVPS